MTLSRRHQARQVLLECREETSREPYAYSVQELRRITDEAVRKGRVGRQAPRPSVPRGGASRQNIAREPPRVSFLDLFLPGLL